MRTLLIALSLFVALNSMGQSNKAIYKRYPKELQKIVLNEESTFRGHNFGDLKQKIKAKELLKIQSETDTSLVYTIYFDADDSADILYYFDSTGKAKSFAIVFILEDEQEEKNLRQSFMRYFSERFGNFTKINEEDEVWNCNNGYKIEMRDTSDEAGMEIEIIYYQ